MPTPTPTPTQTELRTARDSADSASSVAKALAFVNAHSLIAEPDNASAARGSQEQAGRKERLLAELAALVEDESGVTMGDATASFLELGLDSLFLTQFATTLSQKFGVKVSFRQLLEELPSAAALAEHLDRALSALEVPSQITSDPPVIAAHPAAPDEAAPPRYDATKAFGAIARIHTQPDQLTPRQRAKLLALIRRYTARTKESKRFTQENRAALADPRVVTGFRPVLKELIYPVVISRSKGSRLWDLDGNEYVDALNGFGSNFFGYQPDFVSQALKAQIDAGYEVGPQHPLAAECAQLLCELTGHDRAGFCNTGSEAVLGCVRVARTVTGRRTVAFFTGSYHGIFDEVIARAGKKRSVPAAPGIMPGSVESSLILEYGTEESLEILRARAGELAAILVEPIQSRRPDWQPREFLHQLRKITAASGTALIFDEVITGFRLHQGGAQAHFGVKADLASYGKVIGAGLPIGIVAGKREWMDALDGGHWQFGDASIPTVGVTYFAGTFVRHPLALAACKAALQYLKAQGPGLQEELNARTARLAGELNAHFARVSAPIAIKHFGSLWKTIFTQEVPFADLMFCMMRDRGVHILDGFPCFLTLAHSEADVALIVRAYKDSVAEMQEAGFLPGGEKAPSLDPAAPPRPGARLGRDPHGNPAWYVPHETEPGKYVKVEAA
jgi:glutamate-1-semialdehyde aminotransferase/acyl carrier protein